MRPLATPPLVRERSASPVLAGGVIIPRRSYPATAEAPAAAKGAAHAHVHAGEWWWVGTVFVLAVAGAAGLGAWFSFSSLLFNGDALSRSYQAAVLLSGDGLRLGNLSFLWTPLPTLLQLPFAAIPGMLGMGYAGVLASAVASGLATVLLDRVLARFGLVWGWRAIAVALYALNPMTLIYGANGMTEQLMVAVVLATLLALLRLPRDVSRHSFLLPGLVGQLAGLAFLTRYEGIAFGAAVALAMAVRSQAAGLKNGRARTAARVVAMVTAWTYMVGLWLVANWLIMGSPLYFLTGRGSNKDQAAEMLRQTPEVATLVGNPLGAALYVANLLAWLFPACYVAAAALVWLWLRRRDGEAGALLLVALSFPAFQWALHLAGQSFAWLRFHIYIIPLTFLAVGYVVSRPPLRESRRALATGLAVLAVSTLVTPLSFFQPSIVPFTEALYWRAGIDSEVIDNRRTEREVARYIAQKVLPANPEAKILADELQADAIAVLLGDLKPFVGTRHPRFDEYLRQPAGRVHYFLVPDVRVASNYLTGNYRELYARGAPFLQLEQEFSNPGSLPWRLYRVVGR